MFDTIAIKSQQNSFYIWLAILKFIQRNKYGKIKFLKNYGTEKKLTLTGYKNITFYKGSKV
jgi:hypothetical protein